jgi:NAD(P)-dependent dehydrogenase (short-subunit alcohol dehydrogenase family)
MSLSDKVVFVSGANRGIGAAVVRELLKVSVAKVYAAARDPKSLPDFGDARVVPVQLDVTDKASVDRAAAAATDTDVLVNNAGRGVLADWLSVSQHDVEADMNTNYYGTLSVIRAFLPHLKARGSATIANVISVVGLAAAPPLSGYSASKAALQSLTQGLRASLASSGIAVLGIYPGPIDTDLAKHLPLEKATPEHAAANIVRGIEEGRTYIFPDPMALQVEHLWATDGRQLEAAMQLG